MGLTLKSTILCCRNLDVFLCHLGQSEGRAEFSWGACGEQQEEDWGWDGDGGRTAGDRQLEIVSHKKRATLFLILTPVFLGRFLYFLYQWKWTEMLYKGVNKIYHFTLTVSSHYLVKLKWHKTAYFEFNHHSTFDRAGCS